MKIYRGIGWDGGFKEENGQGEGQRRGSGREKQPKQSMHKNDIRNKLLFMLNLSLRYKKKEIMIVWS